MFGSSILDVAIALGFVYLLLSLVSTAINEGIATMLQKRGANLFEGIKNLLNDPKFTGLAQQLYTHGLVEGISQNGADPQKANRLPSYIPSRTFSLALLDLLSTQGAGNGCDETVASAQDRLKAAQDALAKNPSSADLQAAVSDATAMLDKAQRCNDAKVAFDAAKQIAQKVAGPKDFAQLEEASAALEKALALGRKLAAEYPDPLGHIERAVSDLPDGHTKESLLVLIDKTKRDVGVITNEAAAAMAHVEKLGQNLEQWFNDAMTRVAGWYKRWTQKFQLGFAIVVVLAANADSLMLAKRFTRDSALRQSVVTVADKEVRSGSNAPAPNLQNVLAEAEKLKLPLGWATDPQDPYKTDQVPQDLSGWVLKFVGLLITIAAVSLGAPFWFDMLTRFVNIRGAGNKPAEPKPAATQPAAQPGKT
jgi:hypothetical protein